MQKQLKSRKRLSFVSFFRKNLSSVLKTEDLVDIISFLSVWSPHPF